MATFKTTFVAVGSGALPLDMLRYDSCFPATSDDVVNLRGLGDVRRVTLIQIHDGRKPDITPDRWRSFGWDVPAAEWRTEKL